MVAVDRNVWIHICQVHLWHSLRGMQTNWADFWAGAMWQPKLNSKLKYLEAIKMVIAPKLTIKTENKIALVYFNQLSGAIRIQKLVETLF